MSQGIHQREPASWKADLPFWTLLVVFFVYCCYRCAALALCEWDESRNTLNAFEMVKSGDWIAARFENAQKDELFPHIHRSPVVTFPRFAAPTFRVRAATIGYTWDFLIRGSARYGIGANYTAYQFPRILKVFYGEKPRAQMIYLRTRWGL